MANIYLAWRRLEGKNGHEMGRVLLSQLYRRYVGGTMPAIAVTPMGKPYIPDASWHFSISHSKGHAFCVLADCPVGIDGEEMDRALRPNLAEKILSAGELVQWQAAEDPNKALLTFWVLKEATAKLTGEGIRLHPTHTNFSLSDSRVQEIDGCLVAVVY